MMRTTFQKFNLKTRGPLGSSRANNPMYNSIQVGASGKNSEMRKNSSVIGHKSKFTPSSVDRTKRNYHMAQIMTQSKDLAPPLLEVTSSGTTQRMKPVHRYTSS